jgi:hypothetical protein
MQNVSGQFRHLSQLAPILFLLIVDAMRYLGLCLRPSPTLAAESFFLRKQLALYQERRVKSRRETNATRIALVWLSRCFDWRPILGIVTPETFIGWHRLQIHARPPRGRSRQALSIDGLHHEYRLEKKAA